MKQLFALLFGILLLAACTPGDRTLITGKWKIRECRLGGKLQYSSDKAMGERIIDSILASTDLIPAGMEDQLPLVRRRYLEETARQSKTTIAFNPDRTFSMTIYAGAHPNLIKGTVSMNEKQQEITLHSELDEVFGYEVSETALHLKQVRSGIMNELIFERAD